MQWQVDPPRLSLGAMHAALRAAWSSRSLSNGVVVTGLVAGLIGLCLAAGLSWGWAALAVITAVATVVGAYLVDSGTTGSPVPGHSTSAGRSGLPMPGLSELLPGIPDPVLVLDPTLRVSDANDAAMALFPLERGRSLALATRSPELLEAISAAIDSGEAQACTLRLVSPHEQILAARITPLVPAESSSPLLVVLRDMTEEERLSRMRADFVANASHELRTPLASLKGFIETLQTSAKDDSSARERFLGIMQQQADRMSRLIEDLLSLSRVEMRERVAPNAAVDLGAVVGEVAKVLRAQADAAGITIEVDPGAAFAAVVGERDELVQVAHNLIQNAVKYGRKGGHVKVSLRHDGKRVRFDVTDDGIGIAPEHLPRLTERFYRVSAKDSRERGGTGLGLAIVKHIVNRHRGTLDIRSAPGKGSTFSVSLPAIVD